MQKPDSSIGPRFVFSIPLIPRSKANNWGKVNQNLELTLQSLVNQSDPDWIAVVCGHEAPHLSLPMDSRNHILEVPDLPIEPVAKGSTDKYRKRRHIAEWLRAQNIPEVWVFGLDADDWVHTGFVETCKSRCRGTVRGILVEAGYRVDVQTGYGEVLKSGFYKGCGSCFVGRYESSDLPRSGSSNKSNYCRVALGHHARQAERAEGLGWMVEKFGWPCIAYPINHTESLRGMKTEGKLRSLMPHRRKLPPRALKKTLYLDFGIRPELGSTPAWKRAQNTVGYAWHAVKERLKKNPWLVGRSRHK